MKIVAHKIGNKINQEGCGFSSEELQLDDNMFELLENYFLGAFKTEETFHFYSDSYLVNNIAFSAVTDIFEDNSKLIEKSQVLGRLLYDAAENPRVQGGELFVVFIPKVDENDFDKIGIFKTEKRESFLKIHPKADSMDLEQDKGISLARIDKAALIYNKDRNDGYVLSVVDNNKNGDMYYWFENLKNRLDKDNLELLEKIFPLITNQNTVGIQLISAERQKQIEKHGFTAEHHVSHPEWYDKDQLIYAANVLAKKESRTPWTPANWDQRWFNNLVERPHRDRLIIAGALIAAELDRLDLIDKNSADDTLI